MIKKISQNLIERSPVIVVMGHIDHGKSTLLDYIRKTNIVEKEAGGITQHMGAYEVIHKDRNSGVEKKITFLDTPGHESFKAIRGRGAKVADIAILVVSAEDGVKPQTLEALKLIKEEEIPYIVAINKIDKPAANIEKTKQNLAENEIYVESYGGATPSVNISAKKGDGVSELLDLMLLVAEMEELKTNPNKEAEGVIIESHLDTQKGIYSTLIIKDGTLKTGEFVVCGDSYSPVRVMENFTGQKIKEVVASSPVKIIGFNKIPQVGVSFKTAKTKKEAEKIIENFKQNVAEKQAKEKIKGNEEKNAKIKCIIPIIVKTDVFGSLEAIEYEIKKLPTEKIEIKIISDGIGNINESDVKIASGIAGTVILGFHVKADAQASIISERLNIEIKTFNIIYKLIEWIKEMVENKTPKTKVEEITGVAKIIKFFSKTKDKQIVGGKVENGSIKTGEDIKISRQGEIIGKGRIKELQQQKEKAGEINEGYEFGAQIQSDTQISPGDKIECFQIIEK